MSEYEFSQSQSLSEILAQQTSVEPFGGGRISVDDAIIERLAAYEGDLKEELNKIAAEDPAGVRQIMSVPQRTSGNVAINAFVEALSKASTATKADQGSTQGAQLSPKDVVYKLLGPLHPELSFLPGSTAQDVMPREGAALSGGARCPSTSMSEMVGASGGANTEVVYQCVDVELARQFKACTGIDVSDVCIGENPELASQGKRGVAIEGRCIEVAPGLLNDRQLCLHELTHIGQQRGGSPGCETMMTTVEEAEVQANRVPKAVDACEQIQVSKADSFGRLYHEGHDEQGEELDSSPTGPDGRHEYQRIESLRGLLSEEEAQEIEAMVADESISDVDIVARLIDLSRGRMVHRMDGSAERFNLPPEANNSSGAVWVVKVNDRNVEGGKRRVALLSCGKTSSLFVKYLNKDPKGVFKGLGINAKTVVNKDTLHTYFVFQDRASGQWYGVVHGDDPYSKRSVSGRDLIKSLEEIQETWRLVGKLREEMKAYFIRVMSDDNLANEADIEIRRLAERWAASKTLRFGGVLKPDHASKKSVQEAIAAGADIDPEAFAADSLELSTATWVNDVPLQVLTRAILRLSEKDFARVYREWQWDQKRQKFVRHPKIRQRDLTEWDRARQADTPGEALTKEVENGLEALFFGTDRDAPLESLLTSDRLAKGSRRKQFGIDSLPVQGDVDVASDVAQKVLTSWTAENLSKNILASTKFFSTQDIVAASETLTEEEKSRYPFVYEE